MLIYYQLIRSHLRFITQILFQISRQGHDESQVGMVFPGNQRDGVGKKIVLKRHYIEVREFGEEYIGKISLDCNSGAVNTECAVCSVNKNKCAGTQPEPVETEENAPEDTEPETGGNPGMLLAVLAVAVVGGGAAFYFKVIRPKQQKAAGPEEDYGGDPEDYEDMEDDRPPWDEDDPDENSEEDEE